MIKAADHTTEEKNKILHDIIAEIKKDRQRILAANEMDLKNAVHLSDALKDRLRLTEKAFDSMLDSVSIIIKLDDPVGIEIERKSINGLDIRKVRVPIGTVLIIYESRPNVTLDAAAICIKSGNSVLLKGGSDAKQTNLAIVRCINKVTDTVKYLDISHESVTSLLKRDDMIDLVIPRGGKRLVRNVVRNARMPVLMHFEGICNIYIDESADIPMAERIVVNAKVQRPGTCNAVENLIVHNRIAQEYLPGIAERLEAEGVEIRGCRRSHELLGCAQATEEDFRTEYLDKILSIKIVEDMQEAIKFIRDYGSGHSDAIVTEDKGNAEEFLKTVDSAAVYHNASTRFTDGGCFGMGCEMGISTQKFHARGPVGLVEMTSYKYVIRGTGNIRS